MTTIEEITKRHEAKEAIKNQIIDFVLEDDYEFFELSKKNRISFVVKNQENISFEYDKEIDKTYIQVPIDYADKDMKKIIIGSMALVNETRDLDKFSGVEITDFFDERPDLFDPDIKFDEFVRYKEPAKKEPKDKDEKSESKEGEKKEESSCDGSSTGVGFSDSEDNEEIDVMKYNKETRYQETDHVIDHAERTSQDASLFYVKGRDIDPSYKDVSRKLLKYFEGKNAKVSTSNPSARLNKRINDSTENIYTRKESSGGKFIDGITLIVDGSGSMHGSPTMNARIIVEAFSELARRGYCTGDVLISKRQGSYHIDLKEKNIKDYINGDSGSEGIEKTMRKHLDILKKSSVVFCITDGQITDNPIDKKFYNQQRIQTVGIYVNEHAKNPEEYNGALKEWFDYSICRPKVEDCINTIVQLGLRNRR